MVSLYMCQHLDNAPFQLQRDSNFIIHLIWNGCNYLPMLGLRLIHVNKRFQYPLRHLVQRSCEVLKPEFCVLNCLRHLVERSCEVLKPWVLYFKLSDHFEIWQAPRQHCCRSACQITERYINSNYQSRGFETSLNLTMRRLIRYWNGAQVSTC